ncbi:hypothetical protein B0H17DRAFT_1165928 [Mycena rosella]|uniref:NYN domain-containing protein n=1 Tax=Mycena rosella TaxID=1033263 RepID=A0AAD7MAK3_MYCRO|nr:hypothetical protein B0H17DRAFT_1165928 [Mycena rosella]
MMQSSSDTPPSISTSPISPFSSFSVPSEPTSDELPDLGAFTTVLRAWNHLQPPLRTFTYQAQHSTSTTSSSMEPESDYLPEPSLAGSTVWSQRPIASYLDSISATTDTDGRSPSPGSGSNTEGDARTLEPVDYELSDLEDLDLDPQPSLGLLDGALSFIAAERARWNAQREAGVTANEGAWKHVVEPRRKRRRKRSARNPKTDDASRDDHIEEAESLAAEDADDSSSSFDNTTTTTTTTTTHKSVPATPARSRKERRRQQAAANTSPGTNRVLLHSKSTPQLRVLPFAHEPHPHYPRVVQLRTLAQKLAKIFPTDAAVLDSLIPADLELHQRLRADDFFVDPRGPPPGDSDTLIHVFIDHSNILVGLLTHLKRFPRTHFSSPSASTAHAATPAPFATSFSFPPKPSPKSKHLSHAALALILERGRPITRRVLVTSSPLYQPMDTAERLGYEVRIYARVPDLGDGQDRVGPNGGGRQGHSRSLSAGAGGLMSISTSPPTHGSPMSSSLPGTNGVSSPVGGYAPNGVLAPAKIKYREQGVDELLQLKLHQALAALDGPPPPRATIVLATGDGNVGQFSEDGFLGPVRTALKKGWRVELYAWEEGLSRAWMREFGEWAKPVKGEETGRFSVVGMEQFAGELLEIY